MDKVGLEELKKNIDAEIEKELPHVREPTRKDILKIVEKNLKIFVPVENDDYPYYGDYCELSNAVMNDTQIGWDGEC